MLERGPLVVVEYEDQGRKGETWQIQVPVDLGDLPPRGVVRGQASYHLVVMKKCRAVYYNWLILAKSLNNAIQNIISGELSSLLRGSYNKAGYIFFKECCYPHITSMVL
jgi:hypothetical protein